MRFSAGLPYTLLGFSRFSKPVFFLEGTRCMPATAAVYRTVRNTHERLTEKEPLVFQPPNGDGPSVLVDSRHAFQVIEGFGGAFTEAAADIFYKLPPDVRAEVLRAYFDSSSGNGCTL